jgi:hypothetical protein
MDLPEGFKQVNTTSQTHPVELKKLAKDIGMTIPS